MLKFFIKHLLLIILLVSIHTAYTQSINKDFVFKTKSFKSYSKPYGYSEIRQIAEGLISYEISFKNGEITLTDKDNEVIEFYQIIPEETEEIKEQKNKLRTVFKGVNNNRVTTIFYDRNIDNTNREIIIVYPTLLHNMLIIFN